MPETQSAKKQRMSLEEMLMVAGNGWKLGWDTIDWNTKRLGNKLIEVRQGSIVTTKPILLLSSEFIWE